MSESRNINPLAAGPSASDGGPLETAILFVDLVGSSDFASVLGLREYADYLDAFEAVCREQCSYFFEKYHEGEFRRGLDYDWAFLGDELVVYSHGGSPANDVYQLACLAITLKCGWLGALPNVQRINAGVPTAELAAGIHIGTVWGTRRGDSYFRRGSAINIAKRVETASRNGEHFRIYVTDPAFKRIGRKVRNLLFSPRTIAPMKGVVLPVAIREIQESFMDLSSRLSPEFARLFRAAAPKALNCATFDLWIHSCLQVWENKVSGRVTDECLEMCRYVLNLEPSNPVALYYAAKGFRERGDLETARLYLADLTQTRPTFGDGWLELGRVLKQLGQSDAARTAILQARRRGISEDEEAMPVIASIVRPKEELAN